MDGNWTRIIHWEKPLSLPTNWRDLRTWPQTWHKYGRQSRSWMWAITTSHANVHFTCNTVGDSLNRLAEIVFPLASATYGIISYYSRVETNTQVKLDAGYQYNTHKLHHAGRIQVNHSHCQLHLRQWKPFGLPSLLSSQNTAPSLRQHCSPIKTIYERLWAKAIND